MGLSLTRFGKGVIYTAICGGKDTLAGPVDPIPSVDYLCFTDDVNISHSKPWEIRLLKSSNDDPTRVAKKPKILPHRFLVDYDWSLWIDGNIVIAGDLTAFIADNLNVSSFCVARQFQREFYYDEFSACELLQKDDPEILRQQKHQYEKEGMPADRTVLSCSILLRKHHDKDVVTVSELWWNEISKWSRRDQLSLPYILWKHPINYHLFFNGGRPFWNEIPFLQRVPHKIKSSAPTSKWAP